MLTKLEPSKSYETKQDKKVMTTWLRNATKSIGAIGADTIQNLTPNIYKTTSSATEVAQSIRKQKITTNSIGKILKNNQYVQLGQRAIKNAMDDLKRGNFNNTTRSGGGDDDTSTAFGDFDSEDGGATPDSGETSQPIAVQLNPEGLNNINASINNQTKSQLTVAKANMDAYVAMQSSAMTMHQKNAEASLSVLNNIHNSLQTLIAYNNENMTKFIQSSLAFYEKMGLASENQGGANASSEATSKLNGATITDRKGVLDVSKFKDLVFQNIRQAFGESMPGQVMDMLKNNGDMIAENPIGTIMQFAISSIIPDTIEKSVRGMDETFGNFMAEMVGKASERLMSMADNAAVSEKDLEKTLLSPIYRFMSRALNVNVDRAEKFDTGGKVTKDAAVFDQITRNAITGEIPKYLRESTSYLKELVDIAGGNSKRAVAKSSIFNRDSGMYESYDDYTRNILGSIQNSITNAMSETSFGKSLMRVSKNLAESGKSEEFDNILNQFYSAVEKDDRQHLELYKQGEDSPIGQIIQGLSGSDDIKNILRLAVEESFKSGRGGISFNAGRMKAKSARNEAVKKLETDYTTDLASAMAGNLGGQNIDETVARFLGPKPVEEAGSEAVNEGRGMKSILSGAGDVLHNIESILLRGINVKIVDRLKAIKKGGNATEVIPSDDSRAPQPIPVGGDTKSQSGKAAQATDAELRQALGRYMDEGNSGTADDPTSRFVKNKMDHVQSIMHSLLAGDFAMASASMAALFGDAASDVKDQMNDKIIEPFKKKLLGDKDDDSKFYKDGIFSKVVNKGIDIKNGLLHSIDGREYTKSDGTKVEKTEDGEDGNKTVFGTLKSLILGDETKEKAKSGVALLKEGFSGWTNALFGTDIEDAKKKLQDEVNKKGASTVGGAVIGAGVGLGAGGILGTLVGGPLTGALLGAAGGFASKSKAFQKIIFGNQIDDEGNVKPIKDQEGLISHATQKFFADNKEDIGKGALIGTGIGVLTGGGLLGSIVGGPIAGALMGGAVQMVRRSNTFQEFLYGPEVEGENGEKKRMGGLMDKFNKAFEGIHGKDKNVEKGRKKLGMTALGAGAGLIGGLVSPVGPIGGALIGVAASMYASKDDFHKFLFGSEEEEGEHKGVVNRFGNLITTNILAPMANKVGDFVDTVKDAFIDRIMTPFEYMMEPIANLGRAIYDRVTLGFQSMLHNIAEGVQKFSQKALGKIGDFLKKRADGLLGKIFGAGKTLVKGAFAIPGKAMEGVGTLARKATAKMSRDRVDREHYLDSKTGKIEKMGWDQNWEKMDPQEKIKRYKGDYNRFLKEMKGNVYYTSKDNRAARKEESNKRKAERAEARQQKKDIVNTEELISRLTKGRYSEINEENLNRALTQYKSTKAYEREKGVGSINHNDVMRLLQQKKNPETLADAAKNLADAKKELEAIQENTSNTTIIKKTVRDVLGFMKENLNPVSLAKAMVHSISENHDAKVQEKYERIAGIQEDAKFGQNFVDAYNTVNGTDYKKQGMMSRNRVDMLNEMMSLTSSDNEYIRRNANKFIDILQNHGDEYDDDTINEMYKNASSVADKFDPQRIAKREYEEAREKKKEEKHAKRSKITEIRDAERNVKEAQKDFDEGYDKASALEKIAAGGGEAAGSMFDIVRQAVFGNQDEPTEEDTGGRGYRNGGPTSPGAAVVGEDGPEIAVFNRGDRVLPNDATIDVRVTDVSTKAALAMNNNGVQDVNLIGQNNPLTTYSIGAKLDEHTDNASAIEADLEKPDSLVKFDHIKADIGDEPSSASAKEEEKKEGIFSKILGALGSGGGILGLIKNIGIIGGGAVALGAFLSSPAGQWIMTKLGDLAKGGLEFLADGAKEASDNSAKIDEMKGFEGGVGLQEHMQNIASGETDADVDYTKFARRAVRRVALGKQGRKAAKTSVTKFAGALMDGKGVKAAVEEGIQGNKKGLYGALTRTSNTLTKAGETTGNLANRMAAKTGVEFGDKAAAKVGSEIVEESATHAASVAGDVAGKSLTNVGDVALKSADDAVSNGKKIAQDILAKQSDEAASEGLSMIKKLRKYVDEGVELVKKAVLDKMKGGKVGKLATKVLNFVKEIFEKLSKSCVGKMATKITKVVSDFLSKSGITAAVAATGVGVIGILTKDALWVTVGALNGATKAGAARLFYVDQKDVDWKMRLIASAFGALLEVGIPGAAIDCANQLSTMVLGIDFITGLAEVLYKNISLDSEGRTEKLESAQEKFRGEYEEYKNEFIKDEWKAYIDENQISESDLSFEQYKQMVESGSVKSNVKGFTEYNEDENKKLTEKAWDAAKSVGGAIADGAKSAWNFITGKRNEEVRAPEKEYGNSATVDNERINGIVSDMDSAKSVVNGASTFMGNLNAELPDTNFGSYINKKGTVTNFFANITEDEAYDMGASLKNTISFMNGMEDGSTYTNTNSWKVPSWKKNTRGGKGGSDVPFFSQKDPRWGEMEYEKGGHGETMADAGCGPTAFAMAASGATGRNIDPVQSAQTMKAVGARDDTGTNWNGMMKAASAYGIEARMERNPSESFIDSELERGNPVILSGQKGGYGETPYTKGGHYVVATGKDSEGNYIINDPNKSSGSKKYNKDAIMEETGAAWGLGGRGKKQATPMFDPSNGNLGKGTTAASSSTTKKKASNPKVASTQKSSTSSGSAKVANDTPIALNADNKATQDKAKAAQNKNASAKKKGSSNNTKSKAGTKNVAKSSSTTPVTESNGLGVTPEDVIKVAANEIGYLEKDNANDLQSKGGGGSGNFTKFGADMSTVFGHPKAAAWCATFVVWCFWVASNKDKNITSQLLCNATTAGCANNESAFRKAGRWIDGKEAPQAGDVIFYTHSHTGIVVSCNGSTFKTIEGNTSGSNDYARNDGCVYTKERKVGDSKIKGFGRPAFDGTSNFNGIDTSYSESSSYEAEVDSGTEKKGFWEIIGSWISELGSAAITGITTGDWNHDWSSWRQSVGLSGSSSSGSSSSSRSSSSYSSSSGSSSNIQAANISGNDVAKSAWDYFTSNGYSKEATAGILGNLHQESGMNPAKRQYNNGPGAGLAQWEDFNAKSKRWKQLSDYAASKGKDWTDTGSQLEFINKELQGLNPYFSKGKGLTNAGATPTTYDEWKQSSDLEMATRQFEGAFERAGKPEMDKRIGYAKSYYDMYARQSSNTKTAPSSVTNAPSVTPSKNGAYFTNDTVMPTTSSAKGGKGGDDSVTTNAPTSIDSGMYSTAIKSTASNYIDSIPGKGDSNNSYVKELANKLDKVIAILGESNGKLDNLKKLDIIGSGSGGRGGDINITNNNTVNAQSTTHKSKTDALNYSTMRPKQATKTNSAKYAMAQKIASGGM